MHVDSHDPRLSEAEAEAGHQFWLADWRSGDDQERRQRAWRALAERFDPGRAAWVARATRPENADDRPAEAVADTDPPRVLPTFGPIELTERPSTPVARLLPAAWTATAYASGKMVATATGRPITGDPAVGPGLDVPLVHPTVDDDEDHEVAAVDVGMNWLVDFDAAEDIGMALRLPVSGPVDLLLVSGVRAAGPDDGAAALAALLDAQRYTCGLGFVEPGTPTNNTDGAPAGWSSADTGSFGAPGATGDTRALLRSTARALGLGDDAPCRPAGRGPRRQRSLATAVARALWPATWGYWLTQFVGIGTAGLRDDRAWARDHAAHFVRPGGPLPTLRVGRQPYGLLPVTALTRFQGDARETRLAAIVAGADRRRVAAGAGQGGTRRTRRPGDGSRRRPAARRALECRGPAPCPRLDVRRQRARLPRAPRADGGVAHARRPDAGAHRRRRAADGDRRCAGAPRANGLAGRAAARGRRSRHHPRATCWPPMSTPSPLRATNDRRPCWPRSSARAGCASTPPPRPD